MVRILCGRALVANLVCVSVRVQFLVARLLVGSVSAARTRGGRALLFAKYPFDEGGNNYRIEELMEFDSHVCTSLCSRSPCRVLVNHRARGDEMNVKCCR